MPDAKWYTICFLFGWWLFLQFLQKSSSSLWRMSNLKYFFNFYLFCSSHPATVTTRKIRFRRGTQVFSSSLATGMLGGAAPNICISAVEVVKVLYRTRPGFPDNWRFFSVKWLTLRIRKPPQKWLF